MGKNEWCHLCLIGYLIHSFLTAPSSQILIKEDNIIAKF